jgi:hypothetical protein
MTISKLRTGGALGVEDYLYTAGDTVYASGTVDVGTYYRFIVSDPSGTAHSTSACTAAPSTGAVNRTYVVQSSDPVSTTTAWRFQLQQFSVAGCGGAPAKTFSLYFDVARATAYANSGLTAAKGVFTAGQTAYVALMGVGKVKGSATNAAVTDWSTTWLLPSAATACANTGGGDRPDSTAGGLFPTGTLPLGAGGFLQYRPNVVATGDAWNRESNYETRPCPDFGSGNQGTWRIKVKRDNSHFVTLPVFVVDTTPPDTLVTGGPAGPTNSTQATMQFSSSEPNSTFECRLDGGAWSTCTSPKSYSGLADGPHSFDVRATDQAGNVDPAPASRSWVVDTTLPPVVLSAPADGSWTNDSTPQFSGTAGTDPGDSSTVVVNVFSGTSVGGSPVEVLNATRAGDGSWSVDASPALADGTYTAYAQQSDAASNNGFSQQATFTVDTKAPRVRLSLPVAGGVTNQTATELSGTGGVAAGDADAVDVEIYSGTSATGTPLETVAATLDADSNWAATASPDLAEGVYTARAVQLDAAGNTGYSPAHVFTVDTTPPVTSITAGPAGPTTSTSASFRFVSSESGSSFKCRLDSSAWGTCSSPKAYYDLAAGGHTFDVRATDRAGNVDPDPASRAWTVNLGLPAVDLVSPADGSSTSDTTPTFSGTAGTAGGDAATVAVKVYQLVSGTPVLVQTRTAVRSADGSWSVDALATLAEGDYVVHAEQAGAAGTGYSAEHAFTVDTTPPDTFITLGPGGSTQSTAASFRFGSSEPGSSFECRLDGGAWADCSSPADYTGLAPGSHTFDVRAIDAAGNADPNPASATWTVDLNLPAVSIYTPADGSATNDGAVVFSGVAGTAAGDDSTVTVEVFRAVAGTSDELVETKSALRSPADGSWSVTASPELDEGTYVVRASQLGTSGTGSSAPRTFVVDETPPTTAITVGPMGSTTSTGARFRFVSSETGSTFECRLDGGAWSACSSPVNYSGLSADSHTFDVRATDAAGNVDPFGAERTWVVDPDAPPVTVTSPADESWTNDTTPTFTGTAGTVAGDSDTVTIDVYDGTSVDGDPVEELTTTRSSINGSWSVVASPALAEGTYVAFAQQTDAAANTGVSAGRTFTVDTTPSLLSIAQPVAGSSSTDTTPTVSGVAGTADGDTATVTVKIYSGGAAQGTPVRVLTTSRSGSGAWSLDVTPALADGTYTARAEQGDLAGNTGYSAGRTFAVDTTAPTVTVTVPAAGASTNDATPTLAGQAGAAAGDSTDVAVDVYSGGTASGTPVQSLTATRSGSSWSIDVPSALAEGTYTVQAQQSDALGNAGLSAPRTFAVDTTPPDTSLTGGPGESTSTTATDATFAFASSEAGSTFECRLDGGSWGACSSPRSYTSILPGTHVFGVRAVDVAGNVDATPATRSWTVVPGAPPPPPPLLKLKLEKPKKQTLLRRGKLVVFATCDKACTLTVTAKVAVARTKSGRTVRTYAVRKLTLKLKAGTRTTLRLTLPRKTKNAVLKALGLHRRVTASIAASAKGPSNTKASTKLTLIVGR